jgi:hypothetical protein
MALTGLRDYVWPDAYLTDRNYHVGWLENHNGHYTVPYFDGSIAIAYGYDLLTRVRVVRDANRNVVIDPATRLPRYTASDIINDLNAGNNALGLQGAQRVTITQADINLLGKAKGSNRPGRDNIRGQLALTFPSVAFSLKLLDILLGRYEPALDAALGGAAQLLQSKERIAIISLAYHMTNPTSASISQALGRALSAIRNDNRAEAGYLYPGFLWVQRQRANRYFVDRAGAPQRKE